MSRFPVAAAIVLLTLTAPIRAADPAADLPGQVEHRFADNDGVRIHVATMGEGPLLVLLHGFPDFWFTWRDQMKALSDRFQVAAVDLRGYNESSQPEDPAAYALPRLLEDVDAVLRLFERDQAILCGHDWGGAIAWHYAMSRPGKVERLAILNLPHPNGFLRELRENPAQREASAYARRFQEEGSEVDLNPDNLSSWVKEPEARSVYRAAFARSSIRAMLDYYRQNFPRPPYAAPEGGFPRVKCPVLLIHGLEDTALLASGLNGTWEWVDADLTLVTVPKAGHWVHRDAPDIVTRSLRAWLGR